MKPCRLHGVPAAVYRKRSLILYLQNTVQRVSGLATGGPIVLNRSEGAKCGNVPEESKSFTVFERNSVVFPAFPSVGLALLGCSLLRVCRASLTQRRIVQAINVMVSKVPATKMNRGGPRAPLTVCFYQWSLRGLVESL